MASSGPDQAFMDSVNNNTMSNNNNTININNNAPPYTDLDAILSGSLTSRTNARPDAAPVATNTPSISIRIPSYSISADMASVLHHHASEASNHTNESSRESSNGTSRRGRSSRRSQSRHRHLHSNGHRSSRHRSRQRQKVRERNFPAALCSMISIVILSTALAEPRWVHIESGNCFLVQVGQLTYLGAFQFFYNGQFVNTDQSSECHAAHVTHGITEYQFGPAADDRMCNCVTEREVLLFKTVIAFTFMAIGCSLFAFFLDLVGPNHRLFILLRRSAIFNIITVILCVVITLLLYWITVILVALQQAAFQVNVQVSFDVSFYLITAAGVTSVFAVACSCLRQHPFMEASSPVTPRAILDDQFPDDTNNLLVLPVPGYAGSDLSLLSNLPPPPPYTP